MDASVLLRIFGDPDSAERALKAIAGELLAFGQMKVEAEADVETTGARARIKQLRAELVALGRTRVNIDVDVRRGFDDLLAQGGAALGLAIQAITSRLSGASEGFSEAFNKARIFGFSLKSLAIGAVVVLPILTALGAAAVALAASLSAAVLGAGALAVAAGVMLVPAIALGVAAVQRFKEQADVAGTAANRLKTAAEGLGGLFSRTLGPAADKVLDGLAQAIPGVKTLLEGLKPAFTDLGAAVGVAARRLGDELGRPAWGHALRTVIGSLSDLVSGPATSAFISLGRIIRNIATATAPLLVGAVRGIAGAFKSIASATSNIGELRGQIGGLLGHLRSWLNLAGAVGDVMIALFSATAGDGQRMVDSLAKGARGLADWIRSAEGQEKIKQFFEDMLPLAAATAEVFAQVGLAIVNFSQLVAPAMTIVMKVIAGALGLFNALLSAVNGLGDAAQTVVSLALVFPRLAQAVLAAGTAFVGLVIGLGRYVAIALQVIAAIGLIVAGIKALPGAASAAVTAIVGAFNGLVTAAVTAWGGIKAAFSGAVQVTVRFIEGIVDRARSIFGQVKGIFSAAVRIAVTIAQGIVARAQALYGQVKGVLSKGIEIAVSILRDVIDKAKGIWEAINSALPDITINIDIPTPNIPDINIPGRSLHPFAAAGKVIGDKWKADLAAAMGDIRHISTAAIAPSVSMAGVPPPLAALAAGGDTHHHYDVKPMADGGSPHADVLAAELNAAVRARGGSS